MQQKKFNILCQDNYYLEQSHELAKNNNLEISTEFNHAYEMSLFYEDGCLKIKNNKDSSMLPYFIDFNEQKSPYKPSNKFKKKIQYPLIDLIKKICYKDATILDTTCGFGKDSLKLMQNNFKVVAIEKNLLLFLLLQDARNRLYGSKKDDFSVIHADSTEYLNDKSIKRQDLIYIDPMFPVRKKTAAVKKESQLLQLINSSREMEKKIKAENIFLLEAAIKNKGSKVLVKQPLHGEPIGNYSPTKTYQYKTCRFDYYLS